MSRHDQLDRESGCAFLSATAACNGASGVMRQSLLDARVLTPVPQLPSDLEKVDLGGNEKVGEVVQVMAQFL